MTIWAEGSGDVKITDLPKAIAALVAAGFQVKEDHEELRFYPWVYYPDYTYMEFVDEKLRNSAWDALFTIAPYVKAGGYIEMRGENGALWRWYFDGATVHELRPTITWPRMPSAKNEARRKQS